MLSMSAGASSAPLRKPLHFGHQLREPVYYSVYIDVAPGRNPGVAPLKAGTPKPQPGAESPPVSENFVKTSLERRSWFAAEKNKLAQKMKMEILTLGEANQDTIGEMRELREREARELLPLDRQNLKVLQSLSPEKIADGIVAGLKNSLGPKWFNAFREYLKGRPDTLLALVLKHQKKLMSIIPVIGKQYGREVQDALELPVLSLPFLLKRASQAVAEKGRIVLKFFSDFLLRLKLEQAIRTAQARIDANPPGFSETQAQHLEVLAKMFRVLADKLTPVREALVKRLF